MIIPLQPRHAISPANPLDSTTTSPNPTTTSTPTSTSPVTKSTITVSPSRSGSNSSGVATRIGTLNLSWWQLLCIALGGILATAVIGWAWMRARNKRKADKAKAKKLEEEEEKRFAEMMQGKNRVGDGGGRGKCQSRDRDRDKRRRVDDSESESEDSESEDYDSVSDGGTIRPRRGRRRGRKRGRGKRKGRSKRSRRRREDDTESESEETEESDATLETYHPPARRRRDDSPPPPKRPPLKHNPKSEYPPRQRHIPSPAAPLPIPRRQASKEERNFRDSVFSSYTSMKKAAVKLKHVEAKVKLKKQLEEEEAIEKQRQDKIKEANRGIFERYYRAAVGGGGDEDGGVKKPNDSAGSGQPLMIPPVNRPTTAHSSSASSSRTTPHLPTPPSRSHPRRQQSADSVTPHQHRAHPSNPLRQASNDSQKPLIPKYPPKPQRKPSTETTFDNQITKLLGSKQPTQTEAASSNTRPTARPLQARPPQPQKKPSLQNTFQADWLSHPNPNLSLPVSPGASNSIYLPVTRPQDRPIIPKGGLAPAPPPKVKVKDRPGVASLRGTGGGGITLGSESGSGGSTAGPGGAKWADRLRAKR